MIIRPEQPAWKRSDPARQGSSLLEVMIAAVVLAVIVVGAGAYQSLSAKQVTAQRDRRTATSLAESRLEEIRATSYTRMKALMPSPSTYNTYYLSRAGAGWNVSNSDPNEVVTNNNFERSITTTLQFADIDGGTASYDYLQIGVAVRYGANALGIVRMETHFGVDR